MQQFKSDKTSINKHKVPALFKKVTFMPNTTNLDYGGGKYDTATEYLAKLKVTNVIYDPFNRTEVENATALAKKDYDTATLSNVLNVILEEDIRVSILIEIKRRLNSHGKLYISVYEGNRTGVAATSTKRGSCQLNRNIKDYISEVKKVFTDYTVRNGVITCYK
jgi:hypothetical protein